jgi:predicted phage-related endonuclease
MSKEWSYGENNKNIILSEPPKQRLRITGHRIASVLGLNEYQSEFGAWAEITKLVKLPFEDSKYTIFGKAVEPKLIKMVGEEFPNIMSIEDYYGNNIDRYKWNNFIDDSNIFGGIIDAVGTKNDMKTLTMIVECKSSSKPHLWKDGNVPIEYLLQGCLYSYLKGLDRVLFICCFPQDLDYNHPEKFEPNETNTIMVLKKIKNVTIEMPNGELITFEEAIKYCEDWWNKYIETGISPEFDEKKDKEYLDIIRTSEPINDSSLEDLCDRAKELVNEINLLKENSGITSKEKELKILEDNIKKGLMDNLKEGETKISCKQYSLNGTVSVKFNETEFKKQNPKTYEKYCEEKITYRLSKKKEGEDD